MTLESTLVESANGFAALTDETRLRILDVLAGGERCVCDLRVDVSVPANLLSYHLKVLRDAGLVSTERRGRWVEYRIVREALDRLLASVPSAGRGAGRA